LSDVTKERKMQVKDAKQLYNYTSMSFNFAAPAKGQDITKKLKARLKTHHSTIVNKDGGHLTYDDPH